MKMKNKISLAVKLLDAIALAGETGMSYSECQKFAFDNGRRGQDSRFIDAYTQDPRRARGWWCGALSGNRSVYTKKENRTPGLLNIFCYKTAQGRYVRNNTPHCNQPFKIARIAYQYGVNTI